MAAPLDELRFWRALKHLHELGPRATGEALIEVAGGDPAKALAVIEGYRVLDRQMIRAAGEDHCPTFTLRTVGGLP